MKGNFSLELEQIGILKGHILHKLLLLVITVLLVEVLDLELSKVY
jgi:hypothetical protein